MGFHFPRTTEAKALRPGRSWTVDGVESFNPAMDMLGIAWFDQNQGDDPAGLLLGRFERRAPGSSANASSPSTTSTQSNSGLSRTERTSLTSRSKSKSNLRTSSYLVSIYGGRTPRFEKLSRSCTARNQ